MRKKLIPILLIPLVLASCGKAVDSLTEVTEVLEEQGLECVDGTSNFSSSGDSAVVSAYACTNTKSTGSIISWFTADDSSKDIRSVVTIQSDGKIKDLLESEGGGENFGGMKVVYGKNWLVACSGLRDCESVKKELGGTLAKISADGSLKKSG